MRIASRSPQRIRARRPHYLMRDLENHPTPSTIEVSGTLSDLIRKRTGTRSNRATEKNSSPLLCCSCVRPDLSTDSVSDLRGGEGEAGGGGQVLVQPAAHTGVADGVAPVDQPLLRDLVHPLEPGVDLRQRPGAVERA